MSICIFLFFSLLLHALSTDLHSFTFQEFPYKEVKKNEMLFREFLSACEQNPTCSQNTGIERIRCIRECISPSCYAILYKHDELEEGEIDVRLNSFKGCFVQKSKQRGY